MTAYKEIGAMWSIGLTQLPISSSSGGHSLWKAARRPTVKHLTRGISNEPICKGNDRAGSYCSTLGYVHGMNEEFVIPDPWECIKCGMCCQRYDKENDTIVSCQYLNEDKTCLIYEERPIACRLDYLSNSNKITHCNVSITSILSRMDLADTVNKMVKFSYQEKNNG